MHLPAWQCGFLRITDVPHEFGEQVWKSPEGWQVVLPLDGRLMVERTDGAWRCRVEPPREEIGS